MRLSSRHLAAVFVATLSGVALAACQSSDVPMSPNGPNGQSFSTNNALIRIVNGSPTAGTSCLGGTTTCVDVSVDGTVIARGVPYPANASLDPFGILPYVSVPAGPVLIEIFQSGTTNLVFEPTAPLVLSANKKYSFVLGGNAPSLPPAPAFFPGFLFQDGLFNSTFGNSMATFHNASPNAGSQQFNVTCSACPAGGQNYGASSAPGVIVGPVNLVPSANYTLGTTTTSIPASALDGNNTGNVLPDPLGKPNVSIFLVDTVGGAGSFQVIGIEDTNG